MAMIQLTGAGKRFGHKLLFEGADWQINPRDRVGLVGANGTGKTTLLRILAGLEGLDYGSCQGMKSISAGYLPQDGLALSGDTVFAECMKVFSDLRDMEREMETLSHSLAELDPASANYAQASDRLHRLQGEFRLRDGYALEAKAGAVLGGLGFGKEDWGRRTEEFSGGWQMRIALAKLLLQQPNLLLLDEPTNHLDLEARNWLEDYLHNYPYAFVLISHDRFFLDATVDQIAEIWNKHVYFYSGNYAKYLDQKTQRFEQLTGAICPGDDEVYRPGLWIVLRDTQANQKASLPQAAKERVACIAREGLISPSRRHTMSRSSLLLHLPLLALVASACRSGSLDSAACGEGQYAAQSVPDTGWRGLQELDLVSPVRVLGKLVRFGVDGILIAAQSGLAHVRDFRVNGMPLAVLLPARADLFFPDLLRLAELLHQRRQLRRAEQ